MEAEQKRTKVFQNIEESLQCTICWKKIVDPSSCPKCSKLYCYECITEWLNDLKVQHSQCPNCRAAITVDSLVKIRWLEEIGDNLQQLASCMTPAEDSLVSWVEGVCQLHSKNYTFYCSNCEECICNDCILNDYNGHSEHGFKRIKVIYETKVHEISSKVDSLREYYSKLQEVYQNNETSLHSMIENRELRLPTVLALVEAECGFSEELSEKTSALSKTMEGIEKFFSEWDHQRELMPMVQLIKTQAAILDSCERLHSKPIDSFFPASTSDVKIPLIPEFKASAKWCLKISDIENEQSVNSEILTDSVGNKWMLKVYKTEYLVAALEMVEGLPGRFEYKIELMCEAFDSPLIFECTEEFKPKEEGQLTDLIIVPTNPGTKLGAIKKMLANQKVLKDVEQLLSLRFWVRSPNIIRLCQQQRQSLQVFTHKSIQLNARNEELNETNKSLLATNRSLKSSLDKSETELKSKIAVAKKQESEIRILTKRVKFLTTRKEALKEEKTSLNQLVRQLKKEIKLAPCEGSIVLDKFLQIKQEAVYSEYINDNVGGNWRIIVYPKGWSCGKGEYLSAFVELLEGNPGRYQWTIELVNADDKKNVKIHGEYSFKLQRCWGSPQIYLLSKLKEDNFLINSAVKLNFTVRPYNLDENIRLYRLYMALNWPLSVSDNRYQLPRLYTQDF